MSDDDDGGMASDKEGLQPPRGLQWFDSAKEAALFAQRCESDLLPGLRERIEDRIRFYTIAAEGSPLFSLTGGPPDATAMHRYAVNLAAWTEVKKIYAERVGGGMPHVDALRVHGCSVVNAEFPGEVQLSCPRCRNLDVALTRSGAECNSCGAKTAG